MLKQSAAANVLPFRVFGSKPLQAAAGGPLAHRFLEDCGVLLVQPIGPLRAADFDAIALAGRPLGGPRCKLHGLVVQVREFPGWENVAGFVRHVQFLCSDHDSVRRVALATDVRVPELMPALSDHILRAELRCFGRTQLAQAITWAAAA